jgi:hypothetical protein
MALIDKLEDALPGWMNELTHWRDLMGSIAAVFDAMIEGLFEGRAAGMPGQYQGDPLAFPSVDALPLIGRDRRIVRGFNEPYWAYALRLRRWRQAHEKAGTGFGLLEQLRGVLSPTPPRVRVVSSVGTWFSVEADGTKKFHAHDEPGFQIAPDGTTSIINTPAHPWDFDGSGDTHKIWVIIYAPTLPPLDDDEGTWGDGTSFWGDKDGTWGSSATPQFVELIRGIIKEWTPVGVICPYIIIAFDPASFDPEAPGPYPAAGMPDGQWGVPWKDDGTGVYVKSRLETARYWRGPA